MTTKPAFPALDAPTVTGFGARGPVSNESVLPKSARHEAGYAKGYDEGYRIGLEAKMPPTGVANS